VLTILAILVVVLAGFALSLMAQPATATALGMRTTTVAHSHDVRVHNAPARTVLSTGDDTVPRFAQDASSTRATASASRRTDVATNTVRFGPTKPGPLHALRNADEVVDSFRSGSYSQLTLAEDTVL